MSDNQFQNMADEEARDAREEEAEEAFGEHHPREREMTGRPAADVMGGGAPVEDVSTESLLQDDNYDKIFAERERREPNLEVREALDSLQQIDVREAIDKED